MLHLFAGLDFHTGLMLVLALLFVLFYEAINGFHDTANAVATVIYTRALRSQIAVVMSGIFNFLGVMLGGLSVAYAIVHLLPTDLLLNVGSSHGLAMMFSLLLAAIIWNLGTWYFGLPASSSHTLIGATLSPLGICLATIGVLWLCTAANFGGARITGRISSVTVWGVIIPVVGISLIGWFWFSPSLYIGSWNPHHYPTFEAIGSSIAMTLWAFLGLESACANTDVVENPERNVPIAVLGGTLGAAVIYIVSTNVIAGIVPNMDLANSTAPFGMAFAQMFNPTVGKIIMALMVMSCCGSLLGWQFTIAQVFKSSADEGYFPGIFRKITQSGAPVKGMLTIVTIQTILSLMTISPSLNAQFNVLVNLAVVTNLIPYILSMAALMIIQRIAGIDPAKARLPNILALVGALYSFYALYASGEQAMMWGAIATFLGWTLYGFVSPRFEMRDKQA